jgi:3-oxoacyl-[acyl-carrier protein] reductase
MVLRDKVGVITGGSMGIGFAIARAFVQEGCNCVLVARGQEALREAKQALGDIGQSVETYVADVSREREVEGLFRFTKERFGRVDILVNSAGIYGPIGTVVEAASAEWLRTLEINIFGVFLCSRYAVREIIAQGRRGKIINLAGGGATLPFPRFSAYAASKAAVVRLTETMAHELGDKGIDINAIAPGPVNTRLLDQVLAAGVAAGEDFYRRSLKQKEEGGTSPELAAELAVLLASPLSDGLTGRLISAVWDEWKALPSDIARIAGTDLYTLRRITPSKGAV